MYWIDRALEKIIRNKLEKDKRAVLLFGPRQVGKTTFVKRLLETSGKKYLYLNGEDPRTAERISSCNTQRLQGIFSGYEIACIDKAQHIPNIGLALKLVHDSDIPVKLLVTGSSSLSLAGGIREPLTGRTWSYTMYPIAFQELFNQEGLFQGERFLDDALVTGLYPALFSMENRNEKIAHVRELSSAYLYRDILELSSIKNPMKLRTLLRLIAYQAGSEVSYQELGRSCMLSTDTVIHYIDLLEKSFVLFRLGAFSRNLRKEIRKKDKIYFYDNGIRNSLIDDFTEFHLRSDQGALWENFLVSERMKYNSYRGFYGSSWFWRTYTGAEIDYIEEKDSILQAFEFKLTEKRGKKAPPLFMETYPGAGFSLVHWNNWTSFVSDA